MRNFLILILFLCFSGSLNGQKADSPQVPFRAAGSVTLTTKGISMIPNLTLGKPAAMFEFNMSKGRLSFDPQLRFALKGQPWSFLFWWRYKILKPGKFQLNVGAHPALSFKEQTLFTADGTERNTMTVRRYLAGELAPSYTINKNVSVSLYYLFSHGIEPELTQYTNFISARASFPNIKISERYSLRFNPQVYYLNMDGVDGTYVNATLAVAKKGLPVSVSAMVNNPIKTNLLTGNEFLWNINLVYSFGNDYYKKQ